MSTPKPLLHTRARLWGWEQKKPTRALLFYKGDPTVQRASGCPRDSHASQMRCGCPSHAGKPPVNLRLPLSYPRDPT